MPRPRTPQKYIDQVGALVEDGHRPAEIALRIEKWAQAQGWADWPSLRTVHRLVDEHGRIEEGERHKRGLFHWPRSMEEGHLPWRASRAALDLLRYCTAQEYPRPTIRLTLWWWRLHEAAPDIPADDAFIYARELDTIEFARVIKSEVQCKPEAIEAALAYQPWRGAAERAALAEVRGQDGSEYFEPALTFSGSADTRVLEHYLASERGSLQARQEAELWLAPLRHSPAGGKTQAAAGPNHD
ncbi:MAG: hypothetical protein QOF51_2178 [Chloroflexota bacterium]|jgi:hypothetical protein|nr:hypothetical protein [Chloroflexota bacterium]